MTSPQVGGPAAPPDEGKGSRMHPAKTKTAAMARLARMGVRLPRWAFDATVLRAAADDGEHQRRGRLRTGPFPVPQLHARSSHRGAGAVVVGLSRRPRAGRTADRFRARRARTGGGDARAGAALLHTGPGAGR